MATTADTAAQPGRDEAALPFGLKLGWGTGAFGVSLLMNGINGVILLFATTILGIDAWLAGAIITASKLFDVVTDPVVGMWSDRHRSAKGRRRPFLTWGAIISAGSFAAIFAAPQFDNQYLTSGYLFVALCIYALGYTLFNIPYLSMPAEMTDDYHERSSIHAFRMVFVALGGMAAGAGIKFALDFLGPDAANSWAIVGYVCGALILLTMLTTYVSTAPARFTDPEEDVGKNKFVQLQEEFGAVTGNRYFLRLIGVKFSQLMGVQTAGVATPFFFFQFLELSFRDLGWFGLTVSISAIVFSPVLVAFSKRFGKKNAYYVAAIVNVIFVLSWSLGGPGEALWAVILRGVLVGIAFGGNVIMAMSMLTDIINEDANRTGIRREGAFTALYSFVEKLTGAIAPGIMGVALSWAGFDKDLPLDAIQVDDVKLVLLASVSWVPAIFYVIAVWLLSGYKLTEDEVKAAQDMPGKDKVSE